MLHPTFQSLVEQARRACLGHYGERLVGLVLYGSVAPGTERPDFNIDLLVVARGLPDGRMARVGGSAALERALVAP